MDAQGLGYPGVMPEVFHYNGTFLQTVVAGEYIQRFCGPMPFGVASPQNRIVSWAPMATTTVTTTTPANASGKRQWRSYWKRMEQGTDDSRFERVGASAPSNELGLAKMLWFVFALSVAGLLAIAVVFLPTLYARCRKGSCGRGVELSRSSGRESGPDPVRSRGTVRAAPQVQWLTPPAGLSLVPVETVPVPVATYSRTLQPAGSCASFAPFDAYAAAAGTPSDPYLAAAERLHAIRAAGTYPSFDSSRSTFTAPAETNALLGPLR